MAKHKFKAGDKVVLVSEYPDDSDYGAFTNYRLVVGKEYDVSSIFEIKDYPPTWNPTGVQVLLQGTDYCVDQDMLVLASEYNSEAISLDNTKIDVQEYADRYEITLEQAHNEIQPFLFENGYHWIDGTCCVDNIYATHLLIYSEEEYNKRITWAGVRGFAEHENKQIFLDRNVSLTIRKQPDTIEIDGKKYAKDDVMKAIGVAGVQQVN